jgi:hypothetical protein
LGRWRGRSAPLVLLADVVLLGQVQEVGDGLGGEEGEGIDDVDLRVRRASARGTGHVRGVVGQEEIRAVLSSLEAQGAFDELG